MARLREPVRIVDSFYLIMRRAGTRDTVRILITQIEHDLSQTECEEKIRLEGRLPSGRWEHNNGGIARLGGVWTFQNTVNGDLEPNDGYLDTINDILIINPQVGAGLLEIKGARWAIVRAANGITVRQRTDNSQPVSITLEDGELVIKDLSRTREDGI